MKFLPPLVLALLMAACAAPPPQPGTVAHQRLLAEQARENFYALKEQQRKSKGTSVIARQAPATPPVEKRGLFSGRDVEKPAARADTTVYLRRRTEAPAKAPEPTKRAAFTKPLKPAKPVAKAPEPKKRTASAKPPKSKAPDLTSRTAFLAEDGGIVVKDGVRGRWVKVAKPVTPAAKAPAQTKRTASSKPLASGQPANSRSLFKPSESARLAKNKRSDETVYYQEGRKTPEPNTARYRAHKRKYAQSLGKSPEALTRKELERIRMSYRN